MNPNSPHFNAPSGGPFFPTEEEPPPRRKAHWRDKFRVALRGIKVGIRGHSSFAVHFFLAAIVVASAVALQCEWIEWCLLLLCIGFVFTTELMNSAIEVFFRGLDEGTRSRAYRCLDIAAGAVLFASLTSALVGGIIFIRRIYLLTL